MNYLLCWAAVLTGMGVYQIFDNSLTTDEFTAVAWFGGCMLACHYFTTRTTQSNE